MSATPMLAASHLVLQRQGRALLDDISLALPQRGAVALVGPNGSGKTSLLQLLIGRLQAESGTIHLTFRR